MLLRDTHACIDLQAIAHNLETSRSIAGDATIIAVIKANAYGHGIMQVAHLLAECGVNMLAVATLSEALQVREQLPNIDILIMGHTPNRLLSYIVSNNITQTVFSVEQAKILASYQKTCRVHIKIDSGFHRLGLPINAQSVDSIKAIKSLDYIDVEGVFSHLALTNSQDDNLQYTRFKSLVDQLAKMGINFKYQHICDSIAFTRYPAFRLNAVRLGALLYGMQAKDQMLNVREAITLKSAISHISKLPAGSGVSYDYAYRTTCDTRIATIPIGYADGYPRNLSQGGYVMLNGRRANIAGIINMDQMMIDLQSHPHAQVGDEVILYGAVANLPIADIAKLAQTNKNEILTRLSMRIPRVYQYD